MASEGSVAEHEEAAAAICDGYTGHTPNIITYSGHSPVSQLAVVQQTNSYRDSLYQHIQVKSQDINIGLEGLQNARLNSSSENSNIHSPDFQVDEGTKRKHCHVDKGSDQAHSLLDQGIVMSHYQMHHDNNRMHCQTDQDIYVTNDQTDEGSDTIHNVTEQDSDRTYRQSDHDINRLPFQRDSNQTLGQIDPDSDMISHQTSQENDRIHNRYNSSRLPFLTDQDKNGMDCQKDKDNDWSNHQGHNKSDNKYHQTGPYNNGTNSHIGQDNDRTWTEQDMDINHLQVDQSSDMDRTQCQTDHVNDGHCSQTDHENKRSHYVTDSEIVDRSPCRKDNEGDQENKGSLCQSDQESDQECKGSHCQSDQESKGSHCQSDQESDQESKGSHCPTDQESEGSDTQTDQENDKPHCQSDKGSGMFMHGVEAPLPAGAIPVSSLGLIDSRNCQACGQVFEHVLEYVMHQCIAAQLGSHLPNDTSPHLKPPHHIVPPDPNMQLFECTKCRLLFNDIANLKDHRCLGFLNEAEREEKKRKRMVRVGVGRVAAHRAKQRLHKLAAVLDHKPLPIKVPLPRGRPPKHKALHKRRGRPRKNRDLSSRQDWQPTVKREPLRRGRPRKHRASLDGGVNDKAPTGGLVKRRRGRPPKHQPSLAVVKTEAPSVEEEAKLEQEPSVSVTQVKKENTDTLHQAPNNTTVGYHFDQVNAAEKQAVPHLNDDHAEDFDDIDYNDDSNDETYLPPQDLEGKIPDGAEDVGETSPAEENAKPLKKRKPRLSKKIRQPLDPNKPRQPNKKTDPADLICKYCGKKCRKPYELRVHERLHTNEKPFPCSKCDKAYVSNSLLNKHIRDAHIGAHLQCKECGASYDTKEELKQHCNQFGHNIKWPYPCDKCDKSYPKRKLLENHKMTHQGLKPYVCDDCGAGFNTRICLLRHARTHTGDRPFECDVCGNRYLTRHLLNAHKMNHTGERPHLCDVCGKGFKLGAQLRHHAEVHRKEKSFMCDTCGKKFKWRYNMLNHAKTHTQQDSPKPLRFFCSVCGKGYFHKSGMEYHERTHTGERPYDCRKCGKKFRHNAHLGKHLNRVHQLTMDLKPIDPATIPEKKKATRQWPSTKPFPCQHCNKEFRQKIGLEKHMQLFHRLTLDGHSVLTGIGEAEGGELGVVEGRGELGLTESRGELVVGESSRELAEGILGGTHTGALEYFQPPTAYTLQPGPTGTHLGMHEHSEPSQRLVYPPEYATLSSHGLTLPSSSLIYNIRHVTDDHTTVL